MSKEYRSQLYVLPESINREDYVIAKHIVRTKSKDCIKLAGEMVAEQTWGSWADLPRATFELIEKNGGKVFSVFGVPDYTDVIPDGERNIVIELAYPIVNFGYQIPMLFTSVAGIIGMMHLKVVDLEFPQRFLDALPGPKFGIEGIRDFLNVRDRPITLSMIKPCVGMQPEETAQLFYEVTSGGIDMIKDAECSESIDAIFSSLTQTERQQLESTLIKIQIKAKEYASIHIKIKGFFGHVVHN